MIRWFRTLGSLFKKSKGGDSLKTEIITDKPVLNSQRFDPVKDLSVEEETRSDCGKGGIGKSGVHRSGGRHGGSRGGWYDGLRHGRHNSANGIVSRGYDHYSCSKTDGSTNNSASAYSGTSSGNVSSASRSYSTRPSGSTNSSSRNFGTTSSTKSTMSSTSRSKTGTSKSSSIKRYGPGLYSGSGGTDSLSCISNSNSRGRSIGRRNNVNSGNYRQRSAREMLSIISPTNRAGSLNRSHSAQHEKKYKERQGISNGVWNEIFPEGTLVMYTDGSYIPSRHCSGIGIFAGPGHELNRSHRILGSIQNNNYAEFIAVRTALRNALKSNTYRNSKIVIRTDSLNVIEALQGTRETEYLEVKAQVEELAKQFPEGVEFQHVYAHEGDPGNEIADLLAGIATSKSYNRSSVGFRRSRSVSRERNRQRSKHNDPNFIRKRSWSIQGSNTESDINDA